MNQCRCFKDHLLFYHSFCIKQIARTHNRKILSLKDCMSKDARKRSRRLKKNSCLAFFASQVIAQQDLLPCYGNCFFSYVLISLKPCTSRRFWSGFIPTRSFFSWICLKLFRHVLISLTLHSDKVSSADVIKQ